MVTFMNPEPPFANESTLDALIASLSQAFDNIITWLTLVCFGILIAFAVPLILRAWRVPRSLKSAMDEYLDGATRSTFLTDEPPSGPAKAIHATLKEFNRGLVEGRTRGSDSESHPFDAQRLMADCKLGWFPFGLVQLAPGIFTALGLLGTFFGVSFALGFLKVGEGELRGSMNYVISGLASAFWTSIFGVFFSIFAAVFGRVAENRVEHAVEEANEALQERFALHTTSSDLDNLTQTLKVIPDLIREQMGSFTESLFAPILTRASELGVSSARSYAEHFAQRLTEGVEASLSRTTALAEQHVTRVLHELGAAGQNVADQVARANQGVAANLGALAEASRGVMGAMEGARSASDRVLETLTASAQATRVMTEQAEAIKVEMTGLARLESAQSKRHTRLSEMVERIESVATSLAAASESTEGATIRLDAFAWHLQALAETNRVLAAQLLVTDDSQRATGQQHAKLHQTTMESMEKIQVGLMELGTKWASVEKSMHVVAKISNSIAPIERLPSAIESVGSHLTVFSARLDATLKQVDERVDNQIAKLGDLLGNIGDLEGSLESCVANLSKAREGVDAIVRELVREFDERR